MFWLKNVEKIKSDIEITKQNIAEPSDEWKDIVYPVSYTHLDVYKRQLYTTSTMMIEQAMSVCLVTIVLMNI